MNTILKKAVLISIFIFFFLREETMCQSTKEKEATRETETETEPSVLDESTENHILEILFQLLLSQTSRAMMVGIIRGGQHEVLTDPEDIARFLQQHQEEMRQQDQQQ